MAEQETHLPKDMIVAQGHESVAWLMTVKKERIQDETVSTAPLCKPGTEKAKQVDQHLQAKSKDDKWLEQNWKHEMQLNEKY